MIGALLAAVVSTAVADSPPPTLDDVLASVEQHFPRVLEATAELRAARARQLAAAGGFDPELFVGGYWREGPYDQTYLEATLSQATPLWGLSALGGYRLGLGAFEPYDGWYDTLDGGEAFVEINLPLLAGGFTDERRTDILVAAAQRDQQDALLRGVVVDASRDARFSWWLWVAAGAKLRAVEELVGLAEVTREAIELRIGLGDLPPIDAVDAERILLERRAARIKAERDVVAYTQELGLYLRDPAGNASPPDGVLPPDFLRPEVAWSESLDEVIATALARDPELEALGAKRRALEARLRLKRNKLLPKLDVYSRVAQDLSGPEAEEQPLDVKVGGKLEFALLLREARGEAAAARADLDGLDAKLGFTRDKVTASVRKAWTTVNATWEQARIAERAAELARELETAERRRYDLGATDLFRVYQREQARLSAALKAIEAWTAYHVAVADLLAETGRES